MYFIIKREINKMTQEEIKIHKVKVEDAYKKNNADKNNIIVDDYYNGEMSISLINDDLFTYICNIEKNCENITTLLLRVHPNFDYMNDIINKAISDFISKESNNIENIYLYKINDNKYTFNHIIGEK
jgi:hypothetical protein